MARLLVASLASGFALFFWGFLSWVILPWHTHTFDQAADEVQFGQVLSGSLPQTGTYLLPMIPAGKMNEQTQATFAERRQAGPIAIVHFRKEGGPPMEPMMFAYGIVINIAMGACASLILWLIRGAAMAYQDRVTLIVLVGLFGAIATYGVEWNWLIRTDIYTLVNIADQLVGALIVGLIVAAIIPSGAMVSSAARGK